MGSDIAIYLSLFSGIIVSLLVSLALIFLPLTKSWEQAQGKERVCRMAEHRMNARLLRLKL